MGGWVVGSEVERWEEKTRRDPPLAQVPRLAGTAWKPPGRIWPAQGGAGWLGRTLCRPPSLRCNQEQSHHERMDERPRWLPRRRCPPRLASKSHLGKGEDKLFTFETYLVERWGQARRARARVFCRWLGWRSHRIGRLAPQCTEGGLHRPPRGLLLQGWRGSSCGGLHRGVQDRGSPQPEVRFVFCFDRTSLTSRLLSSQTRSPVGETSTLTAPISGFLIAAS